MDHEGLKRAAQIILEQYELAEMAATGLLENAKEWVEEDDQSFDGVLFCSGHDSNQERLSRLVAIIDGQDEDDGQLELVASGRIDRDFAGTSDADLPPDVEERLGIAPGYPVTDEEDDDA